MIALAAALTGITVAGVVGMAVGVVPTRRRRRVRRAENVAARQWLTQAGLGLSPAQFWAASGAVGLVAFGLLWILTGVWTVALPPAVLVAAAPRVYFGRERQRRLAEVQRAWPDGLRDLVASITAGMSLQRALIQLGESGPEPLREPFQRFRLLSRSIGVVPALETIREELADPTTDRVIEVLIIAHQRGGAIVPDILRDLADATTRDVWTLEEIETQSLEQRINARVVFVIPWVVLVALTLQDAGYREFYGSPAGLLVVAIGAAMSTVGMVLVARIGREPDEPRVFTAAGEEAG